MMTKMIRAILFSAIHEAEIVRHLMLSLHSEMSVIIQKKKISKLKKIIIKIFILFKKSHDFQHEHVVFIDNDTKLSHIALYHKIEKIEFMISRQYFKKTICKIDVVKKVLNNFVN
jgi:hypothetical protein